MNDKIFISQERYVREILKKFNMEGYNLANTSVESGVKLSYYDDTYKVDPTINKSLVRSLKYLTRRRPDSLCGVGLHNSSGVCYTPSCKLAKVNQSSSRRTNYYPY